jgi:hypothetical protein
MSRRNGQNTGQTRFDDPITHLIRRIGKSADKKGCLVECFGKWLIFYLLLGPNHQRNHVRITDQKEFPGFHPCLGLDACGIICVSAQAYFHGNGIPDALVEQAGHYVLLIGGRVLPEFFCIGPEIPFYQPDHALYDCQCRRWNLLRFASGSL